MSRDTRRTRPDGTETVHAYTYMLEGHTAETSRISMISYNDGSRHRHDCSNNTKDIRQQPVGCRSTALMLVGCDGNDCRLGLN